MKRQIAALKNKLTRPGKLYKFATFDIKEFYPSIKECLLKMLAMASTFG